MSPKRIHLKFSEAVKRRNIIIATFYAITLIAAYMASFYITGLVESESRYFGALWAAIAATVVMQNSFESIVSSSWLSLIGTFIGSLVGSLYLYWFNGNFILGMAATIIIVQIICIIIDLPEAGKLAVLNALVVVALAKVHQNEGPFVNGGLRFFESVIGVGVGIFFAWLLKIAISRYGRNGEKGKV